MTKAKLPPEEGNFWDCAESLCLMQSGALTGASSSGQGLLVATRGLGAGRHFPTARAE